MANELFAWVASFSCEWPLLLQSKPYKFQMVAGPKSFCRNFENLVDKKCLLSMDEQVTTMLITDDWESLVLLFTALSDILVWQISFSRRRGGPI